MSVQVSGSTISVSVGSASPVAVSVSAGVGPQGPSGVTTIDAAADVEIASKANGDLLRWADGKWRNHQESAVLDGGNF